MIRITHIITGLDVGGAEAMLYQLLRATDRSAFSPRVISLKDMGYYGEKIAALGIPVQTLGLRPGRPNPLLVWKLARWLRGETDVVQTWMPHANLIGGIAARLAGKLPVAWGIHNTELEAGKEKRTTIWLQKLGAPLSQRLPTRIVYCSQASQQVHETLGYTPQRGTFIPNGFDLNAYQPDPVARAQLRDELGIPAEAPVIGCVARFHPLKDYHNMVQAAGIIHQTRPDVQFVFCGLNVDANNAQLNNWIDTAGTGTVTHLLGRRDDVPRLMNTFDLLALASSGEAFPMVVGEAMATGVPCVVTDVGDAAYLVGDTGTIAPPRDPVALAQAALALLDEAPEVWQARGQAARQRITESFSLAAISARYAALYRELVGPEG